MSEFFFKIAECFFMLVGYTLIFSIPNQTVKFGIQITAVNILLAINIIAIGYYHPLSSPCGKAPKEKRFAILSVTLK
jgi:hypothetical protein